MKSLQTATLATATLITGLMAGLFFAYSVSVMPALGRGSDHTFVETMNNIDKAIINGFFMVPFVGSIPILILAVILAWRGHGRAALPWIIAALVLYLVAFFVTSGANVPLNNQLDKVNAAHASGHALAQAREHYENSWVAWNIVRTLFHIAAFACIGWALFICGGNREPQASRKAARPVATYGTPPGGGPYGTPQGGGPYGSHGGSLYQRL